MTKVIVVGSNKLTYTITQLLLQTEIMKIVAVVNINKNIDINTLAQSSHIKVVHDVNELHNEQVDYIFLLENKNELQSKLRKIFNEAQIIHDIVVFPFTNALLHVENQLKKQNNKIENLQLIFNNIRDGLIVID